MAPRSLPATAEASSTCCVPPQNSGPSRCPIGHRSSTSQTSHSSLLGSPSGPAPSSLKQVRHVSPARSQSQISNSNLGPRLLISSSPRASPHRLQSPNPYRFTFGFFLTRCAGTGSASFSHSVARTIGSAGKLHSFEFHQERAAKAKLVSP